MLSNLTSAAHLVLKQLVASSQISTWVSGPAWPTTKLVKSLTRPSSYRRRNEENRERKLHLFVRSDARCSAWNLQNDPTSWNWSKEHSEDEGGLTIYRQRWATLTFAVAHTSINWSHQSSTCPMLLVPLAWVIATTRWCNSLWYRLVDKKGLKNYLKCVKKLKNVSTNSLARIGSLMISQEVGQVFHSGCQMVRPSVVS